VGEAARSPGERPCFWVLRTVAGSDDDGSLPPGVSFGLPLSAGVTIYVAASDLIPEVNKELGDDGSSGFVGAACMFLLDRFFHSIDAKFSVPGSQFSV